MILNFPNLLIPEELSLLERTRKSLKTKKGKAIFQEGKAPIGAYYLFQGKVKLFTTDAQGREQIVHLAKPGDIMGYRALLGDDTFSCSASTLEDSEIWLIPKDTFFQFLDHNAVFSRIIIKLLTSELRHAEHHLAGLTRKPVKSRIAAVLLLLADTYGFNTDGKTIAVSLTRDELAGLVGVATETTIRILNGMREEGLLATEGKKVRLLNRIALERYAENA